MAKRDQYVTSDGTIMKRRRDGTYTSEWEPVSPETPTTIVVPLEEDFSDAWNAAKTGQQVPARKPKRSLFG